MSEANNQTYQSQLSFKRSVDRCLGTTVTFFHVCHGERPGGPFLQKEAWEAYIIAQESTRRTIMKVVDGKESWR